MRRSSAGQRWHTCLAHDGRRGRRTRSPTGPATTDTARTACTRPIARRRAGIRQAARPSQGPRHAPLLQRHRRQHAPAALGAGHGPHRRGGRDAPDGDRRSRHELRPVVSRPRSAGLRAAQPGVAAAHLHRRRVRDRHARVRRRQRQPGHGGVGPRDRHRQRRRPDALTRDRTPRCFTAQRRPSRRARRGHEGHARRATYLRDAPGRVPRPADGAGHGTLRGDRRGRLQRQPVHGLAARAGSARSGSSVGSTRARRSNDR